MPLSKAAHRCFFCGQILPLGGRGLRPGHAQSRSEQAPLHREAIAAPVADCTKLPGADQVSPKSASNASAGVPQNDRRAARCGCRVFGDRAYPAKLVHSGSRGVAARGTFTPCCPEPAGRGDSQAHRRSPACAVFAVVPFTMGRPGGHQWNAPVEEIAAPIGAGNRFWSSCASAFSAASASAGRVSSIHVRNVARKPCGTASRPSGSRHGAGAPRRVFRVHAPHHRGQRHVAERPVPSHRREDQRDPHERGQPRQVGRLRLGAG